MKVKNLEAKIVALETKIAMLEARQQQVVYIPYPVYSYPVHPIPYNPQPWITYCGSVGVGVGVGNVPTVYAGNAAGCNPVGANFTMMTM